MGARIEVGWRGCFSAERLSLGEEQAADGRSGVGVEKKVMGGNKEPSEQESVCMC